VRRPTTLRDAVATAMCADQRDRERRAKSVVVSGLAPAADSDDATNFRRLCMFEFGVDIEVIHARRLGGDNGDRIRPLLIGLPSAEDADLLVKKAKCLRRSSDEYVRNTVFINRKLSKIEARLAYEERCRRRQRLAMQADPVVRSQPKEDYQGQSSTGRLVINSRFHHDRLHNNIDDRQLSIISGQLRKRNFIVQRLLLTVLLLFLLASFYSYFFTCFLILCRCVLSFCVINEYVCVRSTQAEMRPSSVGRQMSVDSHGSLSTAADLRLTTNRRPRRQHRRSRHHLQPGGIANVNHGDTTDQHAQTSSQRIFHCFLFNSRSLLNKLPELYNMLYNNNAIDCICVTSWLHDEIPDSLLDQVHVHSYAL